MTGDVRLLNPAQERALAVLLAGEGTVKAAEAAGVSERTVRRWVAADDFSTVYRERARALAAQASSALLASTSRAVEALTEALSTGSPATRVRAATALLTVAAKVLDDDVEQRLTELERRAEASWDATTGRAS